MKSTNANGWVNKLKTLYLEGRYEEAEQILLSKISLVNWAGLMGT